MEADQFPVESALSGVGRPVSPEQALWYRTRFAAPGLERGGRLLLHFGAVDWEATVLVNGRIVGTHRGGFDPFTFDITDALQDPETGAGDNELVLRVWDPTDRGTQPVGKQSLNPHGIWYTAVTGIWQTVWLEPVPGGRVTDVDTEFTLDPATLTFTVHATAGDSLHINALGRTVLGEPNRPSVFPLPPHAGLWDPDHPVLHDVTIELRRDGRVIDTVETYVALRTIELGPDEDGVQRLLLNGEPLFQLGLLDQGWWPDGLYTAPTDEALAFDVGAAKRMGFNTARKHVKVEPARWYHHADRLGLLVWQDFPSMATAWRAGRVHPGEDDADFSPVDRDIYRRELAAMIGSLDDFSSIVAWVPFNEGWGQHDTNEILDRVAGLDPTRLVDGPSGWQDRGAGDMHDMHAYPGPGMFPASGPRASVLGEFGGLGLPIENHTWLDKGNWGYRSYDSADALGSAYSDLISRLELLAANGLAAAVYTQTTDVEREVNGLLTYDRRVFKIDPERLREINAPVLPAPDRFGPIRRILLTAEARPRAWRYTLEQPAGDWTAPGYDDHAWERGESGFGTPGTPNTAVNTRWDTGDIWLRTTVDLPDVERSGPEGRRLGLRIHHDEDTEVYLNGTRIFEADGYTTTYTDVLLAPGAAEALRAGKNTLAVHTRQTGGGQYIDVGLFTVELRE